MALFFFLPISVFTCSDISTQCCCFLFFFISNTPKNCEYVLFFNSLWPVISRSNFLECDNDNQSSFVTMLNAGDRYWKHANFFCTQRRNFLYTYFLARGFPAAAGYGSHRLQQQQSRLEKKKKLSYSCLTTFQYWDMRDSRSITAKGSAPS